MTRTSSHVPRDYQQVELFKIGPREHLDFRMKV